MKLNKTMIVGMAVILVAIASFLLINKGTSNGVSDKVSKETVVTTENATVVQLSSSIEGIYSPKVIKVKKGTKVRIEGDPKTLAGGMDTVIIDGYNVSKKISPNDNVLEFTADKVGTYKIHCENGQGDGTLIVES